MSLGRLEWLILQFFVSNDEIPWIERRCEEQKWPP